MDGIIILPKYLQTLWTPKQIPEGLCFNDILSPSAPFFYTLRDTFGFELRYADEVDVDSVTSVVFMFGVPYHNRTRLIPGLLDLNKNTKLIMWPGDLQCYGDELCLKYRLRVFERCDLIITPVYEYFMKLYPQFISKYKNMGNFFSPHERYAQLSFNENPIMKCLLSGSLNPEVYPLRSFIVDNVDVNYAPPKYVGDSYAELLNSYFCCVATSSIFNYALSKHYEIPASGSLLLADKTKDLERMGFIPYVHYIPITQHDIAAKIKDCLEYPEQYNHIRKQGMKYVMENHSIVNRIEWLKKIFTELLS